MCAGAGPPWPHAPIQFQRQLALSRYETAFQILHKLRAGMVRLERDAIGGEYPVEVDECLIGGETRGEGRGTHHKSIVVGAVEVRSRTDDGKKHRRRVYAGRLRLRVVPDRSADALTGFVKDNVARSSVLRTDGWTGYPGLPEMEYHHEALTLGGDPDKAEAHLPMIHLVFSNLKTWIKGTHHSRIEPKHLQAYLNEYVFRLSSVLPDDGVSLRSRDRRPLCSSDLRAALLWGVDACCGHRQVND
jgi:hypothetical protein